MEQLRRFIKINVESIRKNGNRDSSCSCLDNEENLTILHDDALLPHFKELANAIQLSDGMGEIFIDNIELHPSALSILLPAMEGKVTGIDMRRIRFPDGNVMECYESIATSIGHNHALNELACVDNRFPDDHAALVIESVVRNWSIKIVRLENCFHRNGVNGCRALASLLTSGRPFEEINFDRNGLSGIDDVTAALAINPQLGTLYITDNRLNDRDAELIARALKQNTNLHKLYLGENNITAAGFETIQAVIYNPSSLNAMEACNNTCYVDCVGGNDNISGLTPQQRRRRKLYKMLSARHAASSNARHLNAELGELGIIKLVPRVLERIHQCSGDRSTDTPPLSLFFELMKSWKMPELYEHRGSY